MRLAELTAGLVAAGDNESRQAEAIRLLTGQLQKSERRLRHLEAHHNNQRQREQQQQTAKDNERTKNYEYSSNSRERRNNGDGQSAATSSRRVRIHKEDLMVNQQQRTGSSRPKSTPVSTMRDIHFERPAPKKLFTNSQVNTVSPSHATMSRSGQSRSQNQSQLQSQLQSQQQQQRHTQSQSQSNNTTSKKSRRQRRCSDSAQYTRSSRDNDIIHDDAIEQTSELHDDSGTPTHSPSVFEGSPSISTPSGNSLARELSSLKKQQREWIEERQRAQEESKSLSKMLADIKRNTQRLVQERDDHLQVISRLQDRLSEYINQNQDNNINNNHSNEQHDYHYQGGQFSSPERSSTVQNHRQQVQSHQYPPPQQVHHGMSPIEPSSNGSSPTRANARGIDDIDNAAAQRMHHPSHEHDNVDETVTSSSSSSNSKSRHSSRSRHRQQGYKRGDVHLKQQTQHHLNEPEGPTAVNYSVRTENDHHEVDMDADKSMTGSFDGDGETHLSREAELEKELRVVVEENARLSERIPTLEAECARLSNRLHLSETRCLQAEQQSEQQQQAHITNSSVASVDHSQSHPSQLDSSAHDQAQQKVTTSPTHSKAVEAMLLDLQKLVEEVDILEGVADAIRFGTAKASDNIGDSLTRIDLSGSPDSTMHTQVQAQTVQEKHVASVDGPESLVESVCKRVSNVRSSLSLRYGRWLEAVAENQDCVTCTVNPNPDQEQQQQQQQQSASSSSTTQLTVHKSTKTSSSTSSKHSRASSTSSRSRTASARKNQEETSVPQDTMTHLDSHENCDGDAEDFTCPMNTKIINQLLL